MQSSRFGPWHRAAVCLGALCCTSLVARASDDEEAGLDAAPSRETLSTLAVTLEGEISLVGDEMGRPARPRPTVDISGARPRDVHALAVTMLVRVNRLLFERTSELADEIPRERPSDHVERAQSLLRLARDRLAEVKASLGVTEEAPPVAAASLGWDEIAETLMQANRRLDLLVDERVSCRDVYERLTDAIGRAARIVTVVSGEPGLPDPPPFERRKRPGDVCERLLDILEAIGKLERSPVVRATTKPGDLEHATPGDAFDLAALVVASVASLHERTRGVEPPLPPYFPGPRLPSHVFQRAGVLVIQLSRIELHRDRLVARLAPADEIVDG